MIAHDTHGTCPTCGALPGQLFLPFSKADPMASPAANASPDSPDVPDVPSRVCEKCGAAMTHLSDLQPIVGSAAMRIFRCYSCNHVVSEDR